MDGAVCKNFFRFLFPLFLWFSITILSYTLILPMSQLQTQQLMTSQIRSHIIFWHKLITILCSFYTQNW